MAHGLELLALVVLANATPLLLYDLLERRRSWPLDGRMCLDLPSRFAG